MDDCGLCVPCAEKCAVGLSEADENACLDTVADLLTSGRFLQRLPGLTYSGVNLQVSCLFRWLWRPGTASGTILAPYELKPRAKGQRLMAQFLIFVKTTFFVKRKYTNI